MATQPASGPLETGTSKYKAIEVFVSYSHRDETLYDELAKHLKPLEREGVIQNWHDRRITAGKEFEAEIDVILNRADIILLLVSPDFIASEYCWGKEMKRALERHEAGEARVIPIILRPVDWHHTPFGKLLALPKDGKAVTSWANQDDALLDIATGIRAAAADLGEAAQKETPVRGLVSPTAEVQTRMLDVAIAKQIPIYKPVELVALIRRTESEGLKAILEIDGDLSVTKEDVRSKPFQLEFPRDAAGRLQPLALTLRVDSPDFEPKSQSKTILVPADRDSDSYTFLLTPQHLGELRLTLEVCLGVVHIASRMLKTYAEASERLPVAVGRSLVSIPLQVLVDVGAAAVPPPAPGASPVGEFTRMFSPPPVAEPTEQPPAPGASPVGEFTRVFSPPPVAEPTEPLPPVSSPRLRTAVIMGGLLAAALVLILLFVLRHLSAADLSAQYFPPPDAAGGWRALTDPVEIRRKAGIEATKLDEAFEYVKGSSKHGGLLVVHRGWLIYERYFGRASRDATPNTASCGKLFTSIAMGILMRERPELFSDGLDQKVYTPRYLPPAAFPPNDPAKSEIKLGQLLAMTAGLRGNSPGYVRGEEVPLDPPGLDGAKAMFDANAFAERLWTKPGEGYSYATTAPHIVSAIIRHVTGMELEQYLAQRVARPLGWGRWGFGYRQTGMEHTPGGGGIALRATDMLRFGYLLLHEGRWAGRQIVPADYVRKCAKPSPYNPHFAYSLQTELNSDGAAPSAPRDAYWKQGSGGHAIYVVPSLDMVIWKIGGRDGQYSEQDTGLPEVTRYDGSRENWKPAVRAETATLRTLELVTAAVLTARGYTGRR